MAFAQTQLGAGIAPVAPAARVAPLAPAPAPVVAAAPAPVAPVDEEPEAEHSEPSHQHKYLPGDPMAPQPVAARAPMLRYDDSIASLPRHNPLGDKKWVWIAAAVIVFACLCLVVVLASKMSN